MSHSGPAICLDARDYSETSQILHFFTLKDGVVRLMAKGARRKKSKSGGGVDLFSEGNLVYTGKRSGSLGNLVEFSEMVSHAPLRSDIRRLNIALYALELVNRLVAERDPHPRVYKLLSNVLARLGDDDAPLMSVLAYYVKQVLVRLGLLGDIDKCVDCFIDVCDPLYNETVYYSDREGGLLCAECSAGKAGRVVVNRAVLEGLAAVRAAETGRAGELSEVAAKAVVCFLDRIVSANLGRPLRMSKYITILSV